MKTLQLKIAAFIGIALMTFGVNAQIDRSQMPEAGPEPKISLEKPEEFQLKNGITVMVVENNKLPRVSYQLSIDNKPYVEGNKAGVSDLLSAMLGNGTKNISKEDFNEEVDFKPTRPLLMAGNKIVFGYEGDYKNMKINLLSEVPENFESRITKDIKTDSLYYWYTPKLETDSLVFKVSHLKFEKEYTVKLRDMKRDSLTIKPIAVGSIGYEEDFKINASIPFKSFDPAKMAIIDKDSTSVDFTTSFDTINNNYVFNFNFIWSMYRFWHPLCWRLYIRTCYYGFK